MIIITITALTLIVLLLDEMALWNTLGQDNRRKVEIWRKTH